MLNVQDNAIAVNLLSKNQGAWKTSLQSWDWLTTPLCQNLNALHAMGEKVGSKKGKLRRMINIVT